MTRRGPGGTWSRRDVLRLAGLTAVVGATGGLAACGSRDGAGPDPSASSPPSPAPSGSAWSGTRSVGDAQQAAGLVLAGAQAAAAAGSFGIAGAIIDNSTGEVVHRMENQVLRRLRPTVTADSGETFTWDPTAHGERQLVYWYFENRDRLALPPARDLTVVTSLDPCAMCTGALTTAGFNAAVVAMDTFSGINFRQDGRFADLPQPVRGAVRETFGYYAVESGRQYQGGRSVAFADTAIDQQVYDACEDIYQSSAKAVRSARKTTNTPPDQLRDPGTWKTAAPIRSAYRRVYPKAFTHRLKDFRRPDRTLRRMLEELVADTAGADNAVAFIDPFGNVVTAAAGPLPRNPAATGFMTASQDYALTRFALVDDKETSGPAGRALTSPMFGTFVWLVAPDPRATTTIEDLGGFGSTMQAAIPQATPSAFQFYEPPRRGTARELRQVAGSLPPLYSQLVKIDPQRVGDA